MRRIASLLLSLALLTVSVFPAMGEAAEPDTPAPAAGAQPQPAASEESPAGSGETAPAFTFTFSIDTAGSYVPQIRYRALAGTGNAIELGMQIDGVFPSAEYESFDLSRLWKNATDEVESDKDGNQYSPEQVEDLDTWQTGSVWDRNGFKTEPIAVELTAGQHAVSLFVYEESLEVESIVFVRPEEIPSYEEMAAVYGQEGVPLYTGEELVLEGEDAVWKSQKTLAPLSSRADPAVLPSDPYVSKINYIGGSNWQKPGDTITWRIDVPETGLYKLGFHFHQTYLQEGTAFRTLLIDGEVPFQEAASISFGYDSGWQFSAYADDGGNAFLLYLEEGPHEISLRVTLGDLSGLAANLQTLTQELGDLYREIVMITGETPDPNRDYNLFTAIPDLEERLTQAREKLLQYADESEEIAGLKGGSSAQILRKTALIIEQMLDIKWKAQTKKNAFYDNYASLSSWLYEMQNMALDLDCMVLAAPDKEFERAGSTFFQRAAFTAKRLLASFMADYQLSERDEESITVWTTWGRDQVNVLNSLIDNDFTPKTGYSVDLKIVTASLIQAQLSGRAPDVELALGRTAPVDYGMRGVLYDLTQFEDYPEVIGWFQQNAVTPYTYKGGVYGLPVTQSFLMMFVRTDILEELGLEIPETWDELLLTAKILAMNNMQVGLSESLNLSDPTNILSMLAVQNGVSFYTDDHSASTFSSEEMQGVVTTWTDFYTKYNFPKEYNFFNRFKIGLVPIAIRDYTAYATLTAAAREISGRWKMVPVPGTRQEDGTIDRSVCGSGSAAAILKSSRKPEAAWEFLKWWTSEDIQYRYASQLESVLGVSARVATANMDAMLRLGYDSETVEALEEQWKLVEEMPVIPGSYYLDRTVSQLFTNIVNGGQNVKLMLDKWGEEFDGEIRRKTEQYDNQP